MIYSIGKSNLTSFQDRLMITSYVKEFSERLKDIFREIDWVLSGGKIKSFFKKLLVVLCYLSYNIYKITKGGNKAWKK